MRKQYPANGTESAKSLESGPLPIPTSVHDSKAVRLSAYQSVGNQYCWHGKDVRWSYILVIRETEEDKGRI